MTLREQLIALRNLIAANHEEPGWCTICRSQWARGGEPTHKDACELVAARTALAALEAAHALREHDRRTD